MATNFFSRWSKRKLENETVELTTAQDVEEQSLTDHTIPASQADNPTDAVLTSPEPLEIESAETSLEESNEETVATETEAETQDPEKMSLANLLVSQVEESAKKAAMRKLFMSDEFNIRDGLDDYDDDYSNLKNLSKGVAETLREWVNEKPEETEESLTETEATEVAPVADTSETDNQDADSSEDETQATNTNDDTDAQDPIATEAATPLAAAENNGDETDAFDADAVDHQPR